MVVLVDVVDYGCLSIKNGLVAECQHMTNDGCLKIICIPQGYITAASPLCIDCLTWWEVVNLKMWFLPFSYCCVITFHAVIDQNNATQVVCAVGELLYMSKTC